MDQFSAVSSQFERSFKREKTIALVFKARPRPVWIDSNATYWFAEVGTESTTIGAQFKSVEPNNELVEINVRQSVFYREQPGMNHITVHVTNTLGNVLKTAHAVAVELQNRDK